MQALTKNDMKPSRAPCFFSKSSFSRSRKRHDRRHVHLVEGGEHGRGVLRFLEAIGDGAAQPRHAHPLLAVGARARAGRRAGLAAGADGAGIEDSAASTSALVARPSLPVGWIAEAATPVSSTSLRVAGPDAAMLAPAAAGAAAATGAGAGAGAGAAAGFGAAGAAAGGAAAAAGFAAAPAAPASMWQSTPPTWTVAPSAHGEVDDGAGHRGIHLDGDLVGLELAQRLIDRRPCRPPSPATWRRSPR